jgi:hypothetical protein
MIRLHEPTLLGVSMALALAALSGCGNGDRNASSGEPAAVGGETGAGGVATGSGGTPGAPGGTPSGSGGVSTGAAGATSAGAGPGSGGTGGSASDFDPTEADFECIRNWTKVRNFYITNKAGDLAGTLAVANSTSGGRYPVGTVIQLIPSEAMVKRYAGFSPASNDWEFFSLNPTASGTTILKRGTTDVVNQFNGNCFNCHVKAQPQYDFVCEESHGCDPLPLTPAIIAQVQDSDPRCQ